MKLVIASARSTVRKDALSNLRVVRLYFVIGISKLVFPFDSWIILLVMDGWAMTDKTARSGNYIIASWLFLRLLGLIYLAAFLSLAAQIKGLVGREGILPAAEFLAAHRHWGCRRFIRLPSLCWLNASDGALLSFSWGGVALALLLIFGLAPAPVLILLWVFYLSLFTVCRDFLCYQWDMLLLETGFLAIFLAPLEIALGFPPSVAPSTIVVWLLWWVLFRLMFSSGAEKLRSGDTPWRTLTALRYHYETQPLPTPLAWHAHQLPVYFHKASAAAMLVIELFAPFLIIAPPKVRSGVAVLFLLLMLLIQLTGNYSFFNLLAIALCVLLVDDKALFPAFQFVAGTTRLPLQIQPASLWHNSVAAALAVLILSLSVEPVLRLFQTGPGGPKPLGRFFDLLEPFRLVNSYGLFAIVNTWRREIIVEGSNDGKNWQAYEFKWKPGDVKRAPRFAALHQPRLDWQMWFAAQDSRLKHPWFDRLLARLAEGSPAVLSLLRSNPFPQGPPRYVRGVLYDYRFTNRAERRAAGGWWRREWRGPYGPMFNDAASR